MPESLQWRLNDLVIRFSFGVSCICLRDRSL